MTEPDPLSEALRSVRLSGAIFLDAEFTAPWGFASPPASAGARLLAPAAEHMILFHLLVEGEASVRIPGQGRVALEAGDIAVLPGGAAHELPGMNMTAFVLNEPLFKMAGVDGWGAVKSVQITHLKLE